MFEIDTNAIAASVKIGGAEPPPLAAWSTGCVRVHLLAVIILILLLLLIIFIIRILLPS